MILFFKENAWWMGLMMGFVGFIGFIYPTQVQSFFKAIIGFSSTLQGITCLLVFVIFILLFKR